MGRRYQGSGFFKEEESNLAKEQRKLAKLPKGSKERNKQKLVVAKVCERIANKREDFIHQNTTKLVREYDLMAIEDLDIVGMQEQGKVKINKSIQDVAWNRFRDYLSYKAENAGKKVMKVNPKNTSKTCNRCGSIKEKLELSERVYKCEECGFEIDRDLNASLNILCRAIQSSSCPKAA